MGNVVVGTVFGHHVLEVGGKISGTMPLEQIIEQDRVLFGLREPQNETLRCHADKLTRSRHVAGVVVVVAIDVLQFETSSGGLWESGLRI